MATNSNNKLIIKSRNASNVSITTNIPYINPDATDANLRAFATKLNNLTTNTLSTVAKQIYTDITSA